MIDTLVICGGNVPNGPRATSYEASGRDFRAVFAADAISGACERGLQEPRAIGVPVLTAAERVAAMETPR